MKQVINEEDSWGADDFEDTVSSALIACFESKVKKNRGLSYSDNLTQDRVQMIRNSIPYIPSPSRVVHLEEGNIKFDLTNDPLPVSGSVFWSGISPGDSGYFRAIHVRRANGLGKGWHARASGVLFEYTLMCAENDGVTGERSFFTVRGDGAIVSCNLRTTVPGGYIPGGKNSVINSLPETMQAREIVACATLQAIADRRFCWAITAKEKTAQVSIGCMKEEIKSLLYARDLPMTATGRKRPILHLVEAHKRRLKSGIDVDIQPFLRGLQTIEINGTQFTVKPPAVLRENLSLVSQDKYF